MSKTTHGPDTAPPGASHLERIGVTSSHAVNRDQLGTDLIHLYLLRYPAPNTRRAYANDLKQFFGSETVSLGLAQRVSFVDVNEHLAALTASGAKATTIQRRTASLRGFFAWLVALGALDQNPADRHLIQRTPRTSRRDRVLTVLTRDQARLLIDSVPEGKSYTIRNRTLIQVLLHCVLRRSEAKAMDVSHLQQVGRHWIIDLPMTKGGADQFVKVPDAVAEAIHAHLEAYNISSGPVWRSLSNNSYGNRLSTTTIYNIVAKTARIAGIEGAVGAHTLRHTGCTLAIEAGATVQQVKAHARHKNLETTMAYVHQRDKLNNSAADYIDVYKKEE